MTRHNDMNEMLADIGVGEVSAAFMLPNMLLRPTVSMTGARLGQVILLVEALQKQMVGMGANWIVPDGRLDPETALCLRAVGGPSWSNLPWYQLVQRLIDARERGQRFSKAAGRASSPSAPVTLSGLGLFPDLPDVPGGIITVGLGAFILYRFFVKR